MKFIKSKAMDNSKFTSTLIFLLMLLSIASIANAIRIHTQEEMQERNSNSTLLEKVKDFTEEVREFYVYNKTNQHKQLNTEDFKKYGGVCWHYAEYYEDLAINNGFYAKTITIRMTPNSSHRIAIASGEEGYCIMDQTKSWCILMNTGKNNGTN